MKILKISILTLVAGVLLGSCSMSGDAMVKGQFFGYGKSKIQIEKITPGSAFQIIDTLTTDALGAFNFTVPFEDENPIFVNVRCADSYVPLLISPKEKIDINSIGNLYNNYKVKGSEGSEKLRELNMLTVQQIRKIDSLERFFTTNLSPEREKTLTREFNRSYIELKRSIIRFIVLNPTSIASIVPLYQPISQGRYIFDEPTDIVYFRTVADSLKTRYPNSPYVVSLVKDVEQTMGQSTADSSALAMIIENVTEVSVPPVRLKDAEGKMRSLEEFLGDKVVLLDFTSLRTTELKVRNREMQEIYNKYKSQGFEIFQVSLEENRADWLNAVVEGRYGWVSVNATGAEGAKVARSYNVEALPTCFLIDREQNIVATDISSPSKLEEELLKVL